MVQETFLRAWRLRETFEGRGPLRTWLYKIATNNCLDALKKHARRVVPITYQPVSTVAEPIPAEVMEPIWLEPYPDHLLGPAGSTPEEDFFVKENITIAFMAALHLLPPRQRAVLILRDALGWEAREVAELLDITVSAVKSALHRARVRLAHHGAAPSVEHETIRVPGDATRVQLHDYVSAWETADIEGLVRLLKEDATFSMPPIPAWYRGRDEIRALISRTIFSGKAQGRWRLLATRANRQPAFGLYRQSELPAVYHAYGIQVLTFHDSRIADITTFRNPALFAYFRLPATLNGS